MKIREFEVGILPPQTTNVAWFDTSTLELKFYIDGKWQKLKDNDTPYELPIAKSNVLGGVKIGSGLSITNKGVLSVNSVAVPYLAQLALNESAETMSVEDFAAFRQGLVFGVKFSADGSLSGAVCTSLYYEPENGFYSIVYDGSDLTKVNIAVASE